MFTWQPAPARHLLGPVRALPANLAPSDLGAATCFPQGNWAQIFPRDQGVGPCLFLSPRHRACARSEEFRGSAVQKEGSGCYLLALLPEGCVGSEQEQHRALLCATVLAWCHSSSPCHLLLSSHHVVASPRSSPGRGRPRWPGLIRDPGPTSSLAALGGGPGEFWLLQHRGSASLVSLCMSRTGLVAPGRGWVTLFQRSHMVRCPLRQGHAQAAP